MLNGLVLLRGVSDDKEIWGAKVLLIFRGFARGDVEATELAFVQCMKCVQPLDGVDEALGCVCLRWATADRDGEDADLSGGAEKRSSTRRVIWAYFFSNYFEYCPRCSKKHRGPSVQHGAAVDRLQL